MGADISMLAQIEQIGGKFYYDREEKDLLEILSDHGVNFIRLRLWNDPSGKGGGENDKERTIALAKRVAGE